MARGRAVPMAISAGTTDAIGIVLRATGGDVAR